MASSISNIVSPVGHCSFQVITIPKYPWLPPWELQQLLCPGWTADYSLKALRCPSRTARDIGLDKRREEYYENHRTEAEEIRRSEKRSLYDCLEQDNRQFKRKTSDAEPHIEVKKPKHELLSEELDKLLFQGEQWLSQVGQAEEREQKSKDGDLHKKNMDQLSDDPDLKDQFHFFAWWRQNE